MEENDQITHLIALDDEINAEMNLDVFKYDPEYTKNEEKYKEIKYGMVLLLLNFVPACIVRSRIICKFEDILHSHTLMVLRWLLMVRRGEILGESDSGSDGSGEDESDDEEEEPEEKKRMNGIISLPNV